MNEEQNNEYDCDKIAIPLVLINKDIKVADHQFIPPEIATMLVGFGLLFFTALSIFMAISYVESREDFPGVKMTDGNEFVIIKPTEYRLNANPATEARIIAIDGAKKHKSKKFYLTPQSRNELQKLSSKFNGETGFTFIYSVKEKGYYQLESVQEVK